MLSRIQELFVEILAALTKVRQQCLSHLQSTIADWRRLSWKDLRRGFTVNFVMTLLIMAILTYFIWGFDYFEGLYDRVVLNLLPVVLPPISFFEALRQDPEGRRFSWLNAGLTSFLVLALGLAFSDKFDIDMLGINLLMVILSSPGLVFFVVLVRGRRILAIGMVPAAFLLMAYLVIPVISKGYGLENFLVPLPAVSFLLVIWSLLVWLLFKGIDRWGKDQTLGPLMESLAMLSLFAPLMVLAIWIPRAFPSGEDWSVVLAAMVGVVFGSVVSEPLRRFLRSYGNLPSYRKNEDDRGDAL